MGILIPQVEPANDRSPIICSQISVYRKIPFVMFFYLLLLVLKNVVRPLMIYER